MWGGVTPMDSPYISFDVFYSYIQKYIWFRGGVTPIDSPYISFDVFYSSVQEYIWFRGGYLDS